VTGPWDDPAEESALRRVSDGRTPIFHVAEHDRPGGLLAGILFATFFAGLPFGGPARWGLSSAALAQGRLETLVTHMFSHAGLTHLFMNLGALLTFSPLLVKQVPRRRRFGVYFTFFVLSGLCGAALYLALHPAGAVPAVGASGAICGLWGAVARMTPNGGIRPIMSRDVGAAVRSFAVSNAILFTIIFVLVRLAGGVGGLAWEAHLGGFLFGLLAVPLFLRTPEPA
jgi:membrane associated rhomboid family serine protease